MKGALVKIFLAALPLAGVLMSAPAADAGGRPRPQCPLYICPPYYESSRWHDRRRDDLRYYYYEREGWWNHRYRRDDDYLSRPPYRRHQEQPYDGDSYLWESAADR